MKTYLQCLPCFIRQAWDAVTLVTDDEAVQERVLRRVLALTAAMDFSQPPPAMGADMHRIIREETGDPDPYGPLKADLTRYVLGLLPALRARVEGADDPFETALRLAIAGNIIDFSITAMVETDRILETVEDTLAKPFAVNDLAALREALSRAESILYLADNAGEIVFDRLLLERMDPDRVTFVVKGAPVINDATLEDARAAGVTDLVRVVDNGTDVPGTLLAAAPPGFRELFYGADVVVSKGQGNYETLSGVDREVFFLLRAKCATITRDLRCGLGDILVLRHRGAESG